MNKYKAFGINLALSAGKKIMDGFFSSKIVENKDDSTFVTDVDKDVNDFVVQKIEEAFPDYSIISEERGFLDKSSEYVWVCDPLDGTLPYVSGFPAFSFSLALVKNGESIFGVIYDPALNRLLVAAKGEGATLNNQKIVVSKKKILKGSVVDLSSDFKLFNLRKALIGNNSVFCSTLLASVFGGFLVATGGIEAEIYEFDKPWDGAAVKIIVEEAGGKVTDIFGSEQRYDRPINGFLASNGFLHKELLKIVKNNFNKKI
ncbi:MAG: inositol monophosphatase [Patescibacteria group bacterium]|jgi:myo-inositol-1(or 4)-monophosphatase